MYKVIREFIYAKGAVSVGTVLEAAHQSWIDNGLVVEVKESKKAKKKPKNKMKRKPKNKLKKQVKNKRT